jgi:hypothetical protein
MLVFVLASLLFCSFSPSMESSNLTETFPGGQPPLANPTGDRLEKPALPGKSLADLVLDRTDSQRVPGLNPKRGSFSALYKCRHVLTGEISAVKEITSSLFDDNMFINEVKNLKTFRHPALLGLIGYVPRDGSQVPQIVTE